jgi:hypothetical protein
MNPVGALIPTTNDLSSGNSFRQAELEDESSSHSVITKLVKFNQVLKSPLVDADLLRKLAWSGCPDQDPSIRSTCWKLLLGYLPWRIDRHHEVLTRKRTEYSQLIFHYQPMLEDESLEYESGERCLLRQIRVDAPRTHIGADGTILNHQILQDLVTRVLFAWAQRNPACGYVQGMNDLTSPFLAVLLQEAIDAPLLQIRIEDLNPIDMIAVEADLYWMMSKLLQNLQDHYTFSQPGIQRMMLRLQLLMEKVDADLIRHLEAEQLPLMQITFRWFNCLLVREFGMPSLLRYFDTLLAEENGFSDFIVFVSAALLVRLSAKLKLMDFQGIMMKLSSLPASFPSDSSWMDSLLAEAFILKSAHPDLELITK